MIKKKEMALFFIQTSITSLSPNKKTSLAKFSNRAHKVKIKIKIKEQQWNTVSTPRPYGRRKEFKINGYY